MKKALKKSIIWGSATLGLSGVVAGITVPIVLKSNQTTYVRRFSINEQDDIYDNVSLEELNQKSEIIKEKKETTIGKMIEKAYQKAYQDEEQASIVMQNKFLKFEKYKIAFDLILQKKQNQIPEIKEEEYSSWEELQKILLSNKIDDKKIEEAKNKYKEINDLQSAIISRKKLEMPAKYSNPWKLLRPYKKFKEEAKKEYDNKKEVFVNLSKTKAEGEREWNKKGMAEAFEGASSEKQAIDKLIVMMIKGTVDTAMEIQFIDSFTWKHFKSGIFEEILGEKNGDKFFKAKGNEANVNNLNENLHFLGTKSNIISKINLFKNKENIVARDIDKIAKEKSFTLGGKMKDGLSHESWTINKENLKKMVTFTNIQGNKFIKNEDIVAKKYCISYNLFKHLFEKDDKNIDFFERNMKKIGSEYSVESGYKSIEKDLKNSASKSEQGAKIQILKDVENKGRNLKIWRTKSKNNFVEELGKEIIKNMRYEKSISSYINDRIFKNIYINPNEENVKSKYKSDFWNQDNENNQNVSFTNINNWNKMIEKFIDDLDQEDIDRIFTKSILEALKKTYGDEKQKMFVAAKDNSSDNKNKYIYYDSSVGIKIIEYKNFNDIPQNELKDKIITSIKEELEYKIDNNENITKTDWLSILKTTETEKLMKLLKIQYTDTFDADEWVRNNKDMFTEMKEEDMLNTSKKIISNYHAAKSRKVTQILEKGYDDWIINAIDNNQFEKDWYDEEIESTIKGVI